MYLIYFDESGNTGNNLADAQQPVFVLAALMVPDHVWTHVEQELEAAIAPYFPHPRPNNFEIHATELRNGHGIFSNISVTNRIALREQWLNIACNYKLKLVYRAIVKKRFQDWLQSNFEDTVNPHGIAFSWVAQVTNQYLKTLSDSELGIFISDENKEIIHDVEKQIRVLREVEGPLQLDRIIEKGFFIDSVKSLLLQLCDLCAFSARKKEEEKAGLRITPIDRDGIDGIDPLIYRSQSFPSTTQWPFDP